jgi:hypothetical protein
VTLLSDFSVLEWGEEGTEVNQSRITRGVAQEQGPQFKKTQCWKKKKERNQSRIIQTHTHGKYEKC